MGALVALGPASADHRRQALLEEAAVEAEVFADETREVLGAVYGLIWRGDRAPALRAIGSFEPRVSRFRDEWHRIAGGEDPEPRCADLIVLPGHGGAA